MEPEIIKEYIGDEARIAYRIYEGEEDKSVKKFSIWSDARISFNEQAESESISFGMYANGKEETLEDWVRAFDEDVLRDEQIRWKKKRVWVIHSCSELGTVYRVTREADSFSCTCPDFVYRYHECKHIKKVKMMLAGENQKNKLPGVNP